MTEIEACKYIQKKPGLKIQINENTVFFRLGDFEPIVGEDLIDAVKKAKLAGW
ncbi:hypothetical protein KA005_01455 [bacterium]|nr:hypothetical protein [bacterium]